jgi:hypothetical protein
LGNNSHKRHKEDTKKHKNVYFVAFVALLPPLEDCQRI